MQCTEIKLDLQKLIKNNIPQYLDIVPIVDQIVTNQGRPLLVGGAVRDLLLGLPIKDVDIEVHGIALDSLQQILAHYGPVDLVGKSFGVLRIHGLNVDWSLPRTDSSGRHPEVTLNPTMSIEDAFRRRDLTINAMGIDLKSFELIDPWNGLADLKAGILRAPDPELFVEDPLRLFRVMQFIGRFAMKPTKELNQICATMDIKTISIERIEAEFDKLLLKSQRPSLGIRWIGDIKRLHEILPELAATLDVPQEKDWHPEGDVFEHTMQAIDAGALLSYSDSNEKLIALYALMCHDLGKATTTKQSKGRWRSHGHDIAGVPLAKKLLKRITARKDLIIAVAKLVKYHMAPVLFVKNNAKPPAYKRLASKLAPEVSIELLAKISLADQRGRNPEPPLPLNSDVPEITTFLYIAKNYNVVHEPEAPLLLGRDLMAFMEPGPKMGILLKKAYKIQIEEGITDKQELIERIISKTL